ncbi:hypothetical protein [Bradyrhizobium diazoefficiens]|nr:hypothetical protein [Bradyrhizobium diazoefficiens]AND89810.1 hypothetical protein AAV28_19895 [Bradyrhizobium diazoefficiens USDA 110]QBP23309.1 hypothetical protein Bdiaspc4_23695 [Bradyrhizobium diazoefficiens]BCF44334.1 hypothetical protein XF16B_48240 [Bradyrhizobium diazoefficiens]BCF70477.1 hypothetical protein XF19B_48300 [Bradyrhizobium diazoefficiens]
MKSISKLFLATAFAAFFMAPAQAQNAGTVTANAFAVGSGPGIDGFVSVLCTSAQVPIGQAGVPQCKTITGDVSITAAGATSIGIGSAVQAFDTDLACIAALSSTGLIKRTGSGTCSAGTAALSDLATGTPDTAIGYFGSTTASATSVPNCTGALTYSTSTHTFGCNSTSAGNVSNVGTPTNGQIAQWTTSTTIQGVSLASLLTAMATQNTNATNPSGTTSTAGVMMGLGSTCKITPAVTGRVSDLARLRKEAAAEITRLIAFLDASDPYVMTELEDECEDEGAQCEDEGAEHDGREPDVDAEPSLGSCDPSMWGGDQTRWASGGRRDLESDPAESGIGDHDGLLEQVGTQDWQQGAMA